MRKLFLAICMVVAMAGIAGAGEGGAEVRRVGGLAVTALLDAEATGIETSILIGLDDESRALAAQPGAMNGSINAFVVNIGGKTVLFDSGLGAKAGGLLVKSLDKAGLKPGDIDAIVITHFHFDHVGGLMENGKPVFSNADLYVPRVEVDKWSDSGTEFLAAYQPKAYAFEFGAEFLPGITAIDATGHTPGHTVFRLADGDDALLIIGDLMHVAGVQLKYPDVAITFDTNPARAVAARKRILDMAAREKLPVAGMHISFPGMGKVTKEGGAYAFEPLER